FTGVGIAFYGDIYTGTPSLAFNVSVDGKPATQSSVTSAAGFFRVPYFPFWQSSVIDLASGDDTHTIDITQLPYIGLDFILVTPGTTTPLSGKTVIVDDDYANIQYVGHWQTSKGQQLQGPGGDDDREPAWAFQNATHETTTPGDYFQFGYTGTKLTLYGIFPWNQPGTYRITVSVDGGTALPFQFSSLVAGASGPQINFPLFTTGKLDAGDHTILVNLTECDSSTLIVDYIAYEPSFSSWSTMPNISLPSLGSQGTTALPGATTT
ncbi:hypothetical protein C8J56DRAFT_756019, partial [Mycena floridula]